MMISHHHPLQPHNTFGLVAHADYFCALTHSDQLPQLCRLPQFNRDNVLWLGGGSNVLLMNDYPGLVVHMANKGIEITQRTNEHVHIVAQAGEIWHDFVQHTLDLGLSGLENLSLIPGTVGAAPVQNIGAYGIEIHEFIHSVRCFDVDAHQWVSFSCQECQFGYRNSLFKQSGKGRYVITAVEFVLNTHFTPRIHYGDVAQLLAQRCPHNAPNAHDVAQAICDIRRQKLPDPKDLGSVGSFYKNPIVSAQHAHTLLHQYPHMPHYPQANGHI